MSDISRQGKHIGNVIIAINHSQEIPKIVKEDMQKFKEFPHSIKQDVVSEVITDFELYCFELANKGMEFNLPSIGKFKIKRGVQLWDEITAEFAKSLGYDSYEDVPAKIKDEHFAELDAKIKQTFFDQRMGEKAIAREKARIEKAAKKLDGL